MRYGIWRETMAFALRHEHGPAFMTQIFAMPRVYVTPVLYEWNLERPDPSGSRHIPSGQTYMGTVGSGMGALADNVVPFDFNDVDISTGSGVSDTRCMTFRIAAQECWQTRVTHMKVWVSNDEDFLVKDYKVGYHHSGQWSPTYTFSWEDCFATALQTSVPEFQNLYRQDGGLTIHASGDADVSEYMYMAVAASGTVLPGEYGGKYTRGFRVRVTYSMDNIYSLFDDYKN
jgi:hypothetical protein